MAKLPSKRKITRYIGRLRKEGERYVNSSSDIYFIDIDRTRDVH